MKGLQGDDRGVLRAGSVYKSKLTVINAKPELGRTSTKTSGPTSCLCVIQDEYERVGVVTSASPRCLDGGDVDLLHRHHRLEGTLCLTATSRKRIG